MSIIRPWWIDSSKKKSSRYREDEYVPSYSKFSVAVIDDDETLSPGGFRTKTRGQYFLVTIAHCTLEVFQHCACRCPRTYHDSKVHGANMGPIWVRQDPGGPHVGPMNFAMWVTVPGHYRDSAEWRVMFESKFLWLPTIPWCLRQMGTFSA